uniref:ATP synthase F0 subunit 8 n=1 Tax=Subcoccinella vigintiquattuorpunctata TaxID=295815 RepID=A0A0S2M919_9CUCU|nr:ATP synthase F0 subunit 8 [Subcoccinella vigintiquattuorpunctata]
MPQMMPLNWICLFFYFVMIFYLFNIFIYFSSIQKQISSKSTYSIKLNWKW